MSTETFTASNGVNAYRRHDGRYEVDDPNGRADIIDAPHIEALREFFLHEGEDRQAILHPLTDAVEGEAWLIEWYDEGAFQPVLILNSGEKFVFRDGSRFSTGHRGVRSARRLYPESSDG